MSSDHMVMFLGGVMIELVYVFAALANYFYLEANSSFCEGVGSELLKDFCDDSHKTNLILIAVGSGLSILCLVLAKLNRPGKYTVCSFMLFLVASLTLTMVGVGIEAKSQYDHTNKYVDKYWLQVAQYCAIWYVPVLIRFALIACTAQKLGSVIRGTERPFSGYRALLA